MNNIAADKLSIGKNSYIHPTSIIRGISGNAKSVKIGDNVYIGAHVQIILDEFELGDYSKIQHNTNIHGYKPCKIGHNAWIGQYSIIDSIGGTTLGNNCGVGAHSQLWSHIKFGDTLEGCRFLSSKSLQVGNDVWFVGHCIVSPIIAEDKSMAMVGSVITGNMISNHIYAGSPAKSISHKIGYQFEEIPIDVKLQKMEVHLSEFYKLHGKRNSLQIVTSEKDINFENEMTYFNISNRKYKKVGSDVEIEFMKYLLPEKAKFVPYDYSI
jgi:acetyltransferase-like isoleucine patch superfamily enzyme